MRSVDERIGKFGGEKERRFRNAKIDRERLCSIELELERAVGVLGKLFIVFFP